MCSESAEVAAQDTELQKAQTSAVNTMNANYASAFANQQTILNRVAAQMSAQVANPQGYTPQQLAGMTTSVNENTARAAKQALGTAGAYAARFGAADVGSGVAGEFAGQAASSAAQTRAAALSNIAQSNAQLKQQNYWRAVEGLNQAGTGFGSAAGMAAGGSSSVAESAVNAGSGALAADQSTFGDIVGGIGAIGSLASGAGSILKGLNQPGSG